MPIVITEDFEGGATGWSDNGTDATEPGFSEFLGRFEGPSGSGILTQKTFDVSGGTGPVVITFDFYEIDDWDGDTFEIYVDGVRISAETFSDTTDEGLLQGTTGDVSYTITSATRPADDGFNSDLDQIHQVTLVIENPNDLFSLGFGGIFTASGESFGIDNLTITRAEAPAATTVTAVDDALASDEDETTGDVDGNVLTNDTATTAVVAEVDGQAVNVGAAVAGSAGGTFTIDANGALTRTVHSARHRPIPHRCRP